MRYSIYNIQYSTLLMKYALKYALKSIINEKRRKFSENSNNTKYAIYNYAIMQDTVTDVKHQKSTHMRPVGLSRNADKSSQEMMKHSHHTVRPVYKAYFMATTGEKATAAYQHYHRNDDSRPNTSIL